MRPHRCPTAFAVPESLRRATLTPIGLIDGDALCDLLQNYQLGVEDKPPNRRCERLKTQPVGSVVGAVARRLGPAIDRPIVAGE